MKTPRINVTLDLSHHGGCSYQQSALLRDLTRDTSVSALLESLGADTLEIRFGSCEEEKTDSRNFSS
jgi:hypothetical protein